MRKHLSVLKERDNSSSQPTSLEVKEEETDLPHSTPSCVVCGEALHGEELSAAQAFHHVFWPRYPRREAKKAAVRAWRALKLRDSDQERLDAIMAGLERAISKWASRGKLEGDKEFVPLPASWLNGERWEDE